MADSLNSIFAPADCPVEKIAQQVAELVALGRALDKGRIGKRQTDSSGLSAELSERAEFHFADRQRALEALACALPAKSLTGAFFQLLLLQDSLEEIRDTDSMSEPLERQLCRMVHSIVTALENALSLDRRTLRGEHWLDPRYNPFVLMAAAAAEQKPQAA
ncbi:MAG TPA: hypothetical protein VMU56_08880 [Beijerinckiaceae bacterium]|nr:hypothetical protein [Beijerinckiaceae bacterium]